LLIRKHVLDGIDKKAGNRQWKAGYAILNDAGLYLYKPDSNGKMSKEGKLLDFVALRHVSTSYIQGYSEDRPYAFSIQTHLGAVSYFQVRLLSPLKSKFFLI